MFKDDRFRPSLGIGEGRVQLRPVIRMHQLHELLVGGAEFSRADLKDSIRLLRPGDFEGGSVRLPTANVGHHLGLMQTLGLDGQLLGQLTLCDLALPQSVFGQTALRHVDVHDDGPGTGAFAQWRGHQSEPALFCRGMAGIFKGEESLLAGQDLPNPLRRSLRLLSARAVGGVAHGEIVLPGKKIFALEDVSGCKAPPGLIHGNDDAVHIQESDVRRQGVENADLRLGESALRGLTQGQFPAGSVTFQRVLQRAHEHFAIDAALDQVVLRASAHGLDGERLIVQPGQHHDGQVRMRGEHRGQGGQPLGIRQAQIHQRHIRLVLLNCLQRLVQANHMLYLEGSRRRRLQHLADDARVRGIVFDQQQLYHSGLFYVWRQSHHGQPELF